MGGKILRLGCICQYVFFRDALCRKNLRDLEHTFCQSAGLVKDHRIHIIQCFQVVAALYQHTMPGCGTDAAEKRQGNGDHQCTGAGHNQKHKGPVDPICPITPKHQRRQYTQKRSYNDHRRRVIPGKLGDEILRGGFAAGCVFHQVDDLRHGGLVIGFRNPDGQHTAFVDAAGQHRIEDPYFTGNGFAGEGAGIQHGRSLHHSTVQGDLFTGTHHDQFPYSNGLRCDAQKLSVSADHSRIGTNIHQLRNRPAGTLNCQILEVFAHLVEKHDRHRFRMLSDQKRTDGRKAHQKVFVKNMTFNDVFPRAQHHIRA